MYYDVVSKVDTSVVISGLALLISAFSVALTVRTHRRTSVATLIDNQYDAFNELAKVRLSNWWLSHLFEVPEQYNEICKMVAQGISVIKPEQRYEMHLKERAMAIYIFQIYENTYYQYKYALDAKDSSRAAFLCDVVNYFTGRLLRNPRLVYFWIEQGGGLSSYFEESTRAHYRKWVLNDQEIQVGQADEIGPFGFRCNSAEAVSELQNT